MPLTNNGSGGISNEGDGNININGNDNPVTIVNRYGLDNTVGVVFDCNLLNEVLKTLKRDFSARETQMPEIPKRDIKEKNKANNMTPEYFENVICNTYLPYFTQIDEFFRKNNNKPVLDIYNDVCETLQIEYLSHKDEYVRFETFIAEFCRSYLGSSGYSPEYNKMCKIIIHYMYWHCDVGINK